MDRFLSRIAEVSSADRAWAREGHETFLELRKEVDIRQRLDLDRAWTEALWRMALSPFSSRPPSSPQEYHFFLAPMLGKGGEKLLRMHRQSHLIAIPWIDDVFLERVRIDYLDYLLHDSWTIEDLDLLWFRFSQGTVCRQLVSVFSCDYRAEQQKSFDGQVSLQRSQDHVHLFPKVIGRLEEAFWGRESLFGWIAVQLLPEWQSQNWQYFIRWFEGAAYHFCKSYDQRDPLHISEALEASLQELR